MATTTTNRVATTPGSTSATSGSGAGGADGAAAPEAKKSKKKLIIIGVVALVVVGVGAKMTILAPKTSAAAAAAAKAKTPPVYGPIVALPEQTLNLADGHYLKLSVVIQLKKDAKVAAAPDAGTTTAALSAASQAVIQTYSALTQPELTGAANQKTAKDALIKKLDPIYPTEVSDIYLPEFLMSS